MAKRNTEGGPNYIRNTGISKGRNLRLEVVGEVSQAEYNFLNGMVHFTAGTLSKNNEQHLLYVSGIMLRLIIFLLAKVNESETL